MNGRKSISVKVTLTPELFEKIEKLRAKMFPIPSRSRIIRMLIERGLEAVEREMEIEEESKVEEVEEVKVHEGKSEIGIKGERVEGENEILGIPLKTILKCVLKVQEETGSIRILDLKDVLESEVGREINVRDVMAILRELSNMGLIEVKGLSRVLSDRAVKMISEK